MDALPRRSGVLLDPDRLDYELSRRGVNQRQLAKLSGVPAVTISRARHGRHLRESTLRRLTTALLRIPLLDGAELLIKGGPATAAAAPIPKQPAKRRSKVA